MGYVQLCREGGECHVKARIVPEHKVNNKPYTVVCKINEVDDVIVDSTCEDCAANPMSSHYQRPRGDEVLISLVIL